MRQVPRLALGDFMAGGASARAFEAALLAGLKDYGFIVLADHGVATELLDRAYAMAVDLFAAPLPEKTVHAGGMRGYTPFGTEHARGSRVPDLKEFWQIGREGAAPANLWPDIPGFRETFVALFEALDSTGRQLLRALAPGLGVAPDHFEPMVAGGTSLLRLLHYPQVPAGIEQGAVRSAAHEDINFLTILVAARGGGLELLDRDGCWLAVDAEPGELIVDSGDMLQRLTNGVIPATTHRVVNPRGGVNESRYSMPFFLQPAMETSLAPLASCVGDGARWPVVTAGAYLDERLREIGLGR